MAGIPNFPPFSVQESRESLAPRWEKWTKRFETFLIAFGVTIPARKKALLLYCAGDEVQEIFDTLVVPNPAAQGNAPPPDEYAIALQVLNDYFLPQRNTVFEVYKFRQASQREYESIDEYHARLRSLAMNCGFANVDQEIFSHIVQTCFSHSLRRKALREPGLTLAELITFAKSYELADKQASAIESKELLSTNAIHDNQSNPKTIDETDCSYGIAAINKVKPSTSLNTKRTFSHNPFLSDNPAVVEQQSHKYNYQQQPSYNQQQLPSYNQQQLPSYNQQQQSSYNQQQQSSYNQQQQSSSNQQHQPSSNQQHQPSSNQQQQPSSNQQQQHSSNQQQQPSSTQHQQKPYLFHQPQSSCFYPQPAPPLAQLHSYITHTDAYHGNTFPHQAAPRKYIPTSLSSCFNCGGEFPHPQGRSHCPARNSTCSWCGKLGHFETTCRSKYQESRQTVNTLQPDATVYLQDDSIGSLEELQL